VYLYLEMSRQINFNDTGISKQSASEFPFDLLKLFLSLLNYKGSFDAEQNGEYIILALVITVDP
jgi:hypothetical protein